LQIPCLLSILVGFNPDTEVQGLDAFPSDTWPTVDLVFQMYHLMINLGMIFVAIGFVACGLWIWKRKLWTNRWMLRVLVVSILLTQLATLSGWWTAEFGRQPWIVWELLRTSGAQSPNVSAGQVAFSLGMFVVLYAIVLTVFLVLLNQKIKQGPPGPPEDDHHESLPDSLGEIFGRKPRAASRKPATTAVGPTPDEVR
jgi:cytochrome d ubiquinol oxidase subunit I